MEQEITMCALDQQQDKRKEAAVLSEALSRCTACMGLSPTQIARLLNLQANVAARVLTGTFTLRRSEDEADRWNRATLLVTLYTELWRMFRDDQKIKTWLAQYNATLSDSPLSWLESPSQLEALINYVRTHGSGR